MDKLKLNLEMLEVQTFETVADPARQAGTVLAFATNNLVEDSCAVTFCTDCDNSETGCDVENTNNCESVNPMNCQSAYYTDCCGGGSDSLCMLTNEDPWHQGCS